MSNIPYRLFWIRYMVREHAFNRPAAYYRMELDGLLYSKWLAQDKAA